MAMPRVRLTNAADLLGAARGEIGSPGVRRIEAEADTDAGVAMVVLPPDMRAALGLALLGTRRVRYSNGGEADLPWGAGVVLDLGGRRLLCDALVEPWRKRPLVGGAALEALGFLPERDDGGWSSSGPLPMRGEHGQHDARVVRPRARTERPRPIQRRRWMNGIDETIERVESLYRTLTGREPPAFATLGIPPEKDPMQHVTEQVERLLSTLAQPPASPQATAAASCPPLSVWESPTELRLCVELPGATRESVRLGVTNGLLTVAASPTGTEEGFQLRACERPVGEFLRSIALPSGVTEQDVQARMRDGILEIRLTKREATPTKVRPIPVA
jgi:HSP20 family protein